MQESYLDLNARSRFFQYAYSSTPAMVMRTTGAGSKYPYAIRDADGEFLNGSNTYRLHLPPDPPAALFWAVTTELVFQPMLELLAYLRDNGFKTYIVSGGGVEFMRPWTEQVYGIPPEQVVGSTIATELALQDGVPVLVRRPEMDFLDDKEGKPVAINKFIGQRPIFAAGNSDGDFQMLEDSRRRHAFGMLIKARSASSPTTARAISAC